MLRFAVAAAAALAFAVHPATPRLRSPFDVVVTLARPGEPVPSATFVDQSGRAISFAGYRGDTVAIAFIYLRCRDECPLVTQKLKLAASDLQGGPFRFAEVTIDPGNDNPAAVRAYAHQYVLDDAEQSVLTGEPSSVETFDREMGVDAVASGPDSILHNDRIALVEPNGTIAQFIDGRSWTSADLAAQMRHISGENASAVDRFDLWLGAAAAFCGGLVAGRAGVGDVVGSIAVFGIGIGLLVWLARRMSSTSA